MEYRILGKTGLKISRLGFGGIPIQRIDASGTRELMLQLRQAGINYIDTARGYTVSESYLGQALEGIRQDFILATKSMARTKEAMAKDIDISLNNLRTDYIDLYQVHNPSMAQLEQVIAPGGALEALLEARAAGKIGHIGLTAHSTEVFEKALTLDWVETIMFPYNTVVIPGMASPEELAQNLAAANDHSPLSPEETAQMETIRKTLGTQFCRRCNYCQPCTVGINISGAFLFHGYLARYGLADWAKDRYNGLSVKASACIGCGACEGRCPYNLPIRQMLKKVAADFGE